jgi:hypothetical protein
MRDPKRIKRILDLIEYIWGMHPDTRYMQLIHHLQWMYSKHNNEVGKKTLYKKDKHKLGDFYMKEPVVDLFNLEDDKLEKFLVDYIDEVNNERGDQYK